MPDRAGPRDRSAASRKSRSWVGNEPGNASVAGDGARGRPWSPSTSPNEEQASCSSDSFRPGLVVVRPDFPRSMIELQGLTPDEETCRDYLISSPTTGHIAGMAVRNPQVVSFARHCGVTVHT